MNTPSPKLCGPTNASGLRRSPRRGSDGVWSPAGGLREPGCVLFPSHADLRLSRVPSCFAHPAGMPLPWAPAMDSNKLSFKTGPGDPPPNMGLPSCLINPGPQSRAPGVGDTGDTGAAVPTLGIARSHRPVHPRPPPRRGITQGGLAM